MSKSDYDITSLQLGIEAAKKNIKTFEDAIEKERQTIKDYKIMIAHLEEKAKKHGDSDNRSSD